MPHDNAAQISDCTDSIGSHVLLYTDRNLAFMSALCGTFYLSSRCLCFSPTLESTIPHVLLVEYSMLNILRICFGCLEYSFWCESQSGPQVQS